MPSGRQWKSARETKSAKSSGALEKSQYEDVAALQRERLTELLLHCKAHVPAYESVLPDEDTIRQDPYAALRCVQPLAKRTFQTEAEAHLADNVPQSRALQTAPAARPENRYAFS